MSGDTNPFDDVVEEPAEEEGQEDVSTSDRAGTLDQEVEPQGSQSESASVRTVQKQDAESAVRPEDSKPGFPTSERTRETIYVRESTLKDFSDFLMDAEMELAKEFDIRNTDRRELHDALLSEAIRELDAEQVAVEVVKDRGFEP